MLTQAPVHLANWYGGWGMILASFLVGAGIGLRFHEETFLGGYTSFPRRMLRLGHIALAGLGFLNVLYALAPWPVMGSWQSAVAAAGLIAGGTGMPVVCFLSSANPRFRGLFPLPVVALVLAVVGILMG